MRVYSPFIRQYLEAVEHTEAPRLFHLWCALSGLGSALGHRCWMPFGPWKIYPNQYVVLVGPPSTKKSSATDIIETLLAKHTGIKFAPPDTAGQRQGLIVAMGGKSEVDDDSKQEARLEAVAQELNDERISSLADLEGVRIRNEGEDAALSGHAEDAHSLFAITTEFTGFIGKGNVQLLQFLTAMWDASKPYRYQLKSSELVLHKPNPMLNILGCSTPVSIADSLPPSSDGQGFLSRVILVYAAKKEKEIARPRPIPEHLLNSLGSHLNHVWQDFHGPFTETPAALAFSEELYTTKVNNDDPRFAYYADRRYNHMLKLAMILAASRGSMEIEVKDHEEANNILRLTEEKMPDALGQFGLNKLAVVKHIILEYLRGVDTPLQAAEIFARFHRDGRQTDIAECLADLVNAGEVKQLETRDGLCYAAKRRAKRAEQKLIENLITETDPEPASQLQADVQAGASTQVIALRPRRD